MAISSSRFRDVLRIEKPTRGKNSFGELAITGWVLIDDVYCEAVQPTSPDRTHEIAAANRVATERLMQFRLRTPVDLAGDYRLIWNGEAYGVEGTLPDPTTATVLVTGRFLDGRDGR